MVIEPRGPRESFTEPPIDSKRPRVRRRLPTIPRHSLTRSRRVLIALAKIAGIILVILIVLATINWVLGGLDTEGDGPSRTDNSPSDPADVDGPAAPESPADGASPDETTSGQTEGDLVGDDVGEVDSDPFGLTVTPSSGLVDGQEIEFSATLTPDEVVSLTAQICAAGNYTACTQLSPVSMVLPSDEVTASLFVPRRFNTASGGIHDCVASSPCELRVLVWINSLQSEPATASLEFDPTAPARPSQQVELLPEGPYSTTESVTVASGEVTEYDLLQCAVSEDAQCEPLARETQPSPSGILLDRVVTLHRNINTPGGSHDCVLDGPCELRIVPWTSVLVDAVPLQFDPNSPPIPPPEALVRPSLDLDDGQLVEVRATHDGGIEPLVSLCRSETSTCLFLGGLGSLDGVETSYFHLPRHFIVVTEDGPDTVDCVEDDCELRIQGERSSRDLPVSFDQTAVRPRAEILLEATTPLFPQSVATVRGRNFFVIDPENPPWVELILCSTTADQFSSACGRLRNSPSLIGVDGTFSVEISIPTEDVFGPFAGSRTLCTPTCRILAGTDYEGQGDSAVQLEIEVQVEPD